MRSASVVRQALLHSQPSPPPAEASRWAGFLYGLAQLPFGVRLLLRERELGKRAVVPVLVVTAICAIAAAGAARRGTAQDGASAFFVTLVGIASMPPILFAGSFARLAAATRNGLGLGPRVPHVRTLRALINESVAQAILLALGIVPLVVVAELVPEVGWLLALVLGGAWTLHWIVVEALDSARTLPPELTPAPESGPTPWYARMYERSARGPLAPLGRFGRLVGRLGRRWDHEVATIEARPWIAAGFAVGAALLLAIPGLNLLFRPAVVVAAAHLLGQVERAEQ